MYVYISAKKKIIENNSILEITSCHKLEVYINFL